MQILKVTDEAFRQYGKVIKDIDVSDIITAMSETPCPDDVVYEPSIESLEACKSAQSVSDSLYGGMPIQIGYCNGHNHLLNAVEYHRDSEINIAVTDLILILGKEQDITEDHTPGMRPSVFAPWKPRGPFVRPHPDAAGVRPADPRDAAGADRPASERYDADSDGRLDDLFPAFPDRRLVRHEFYAYA